jgi:uncharacterized membrane protein YcgQ (UPF0703/DUF1980 family)
VELLTCKQTNTGKNQTEIKGETWLATGGRLLVEDNHDFISNAVRAVAVEEVERPSASATEYRIIISAHIGAAFLLR